MKRLQLLAFLFLIVFFINCNLSTEAPLDDITGKGALLTTRFNSFEELQKVVKIEYTKGRKSRVELTQQSNNQSIKSILETGVSEQDFLRTRDGNLWDKMMLTYHSPYFVINRNDLMKLYILSRRRHKIFGGGDVAFYDLAENMMHNISPVDTASLRPNDVSEKGYINTFNHIVAQALMTTIFSEKLADFVADTHERKNMPELITGVFTEAQLKDIKNGPVDNYIDMVNNEWGQELGKLLKDKFQINRETYWSPQLLADYLNELQSYFSWVFEIGFQPFKPTDEVITRFAKKINDTMEGDTVVR